MSRYGEFDPLLVQQELFDHEFIIQGWFDYSLINPLVHYSGILKEWTGSQWIKKKLYTYNGVSFGQKPLKMWNGTDWVLIDIY